MALVLGLLDGLSYEEQPESYSGFLTVDKNYDSNMFFWFIPATVSKDFFQSSSSTYSRVPSISAALLFQERNWLPKTGWASTNAAGCRWAAATASILPKTGWAIAHPAHLPLTPLTLKQLLLGVILCFFMHLRWPWLLRLFA